MSDYHAKQRPNKIKTYRRLFIKPKQSVKTAFLMPSSECRDVKYLLQAKIITKDTHLYVVEREEEIHYQMLQKLKSLGFTRGKNLSDWCCNLHDVPNLPKPLDFCFLDLFGSILMRDAKWMVDVLVPNLVRSSQVYITMLASHRGNGWIIEFWDMINKKYPDIKNDFHQTHQYRDEYDEKPLLWLKAIFHQFDFAFGELYPYTDGDKRGEMLSIGMSDFELRPDPENYLSNEDIYRSIDHNKVKEFYSKPDTNQSNEEIDVENKLREQIKFTRKDKLEKLLKSMNRKLWRDEDGVYVMNSNKTFETFYTIFEACQHFGIN